MTMKELAEKLATETQRPVTDATALTKKYDFTLVFGRAVTELTPPSEPLPDMFSALQSIGLRLDAVKRPLEVTVIDHIDRTPIEN